MLKKDMYLQIEMAHHVLYANVKKHALVIFMNSKDKSYELSKSEKRVEGKGKLQRT